MLTSRPQPNKVNVFHRAVTFCGESSSVPSGQTKDRSKRRQLKDEGEEDGWTDLSFDHLEVVSSRTFCTAPVNSQQLESGRSKDQSSFTKMLSSSYCEGDDTDMQSSSSTVDNTQRGILKSSVPLLNLSNIRLSRRSAVSCPDKDDDSWSSTSSTRFRIIPTFRSSQQKRSLAVSREDCFSAFSEASSAGIEPITGCRVVNLVGRRRSLPPTLGRCEDGRSLGESENETLQEECLSSESFSHDLGVGSLSGVDFLSPQHALQTYRNQDNELVLMHQLAADAILEDNLDDESRSTDPDDKTRKTTAYSDAVQSQCPLHVDRATTRLPSNEESELQNSLFLPLRTLSSPNEDSKPVDEEEGWRDALTSDSAPKAAAQSPSVRCVFSSHLAGQLTLRGVRHISYFTEGLKEEIDSAPSSTPLPLVRRGSFGSTTAWPMQLLRRKNNPNVNDNYLNSNHNGANADKQTQRTQESCYQCEVPKPETGESSCLDNSRRSSICPPPCTSSEGSSSSLALTKADMFLRSLFQGRNTDIPKGRPNGSSIENDKEDFQSKQQNSDDISFQDDPPRVPPRPRAKTVDEARLRLHPPVLNKNENPESSSKRLLMASTSSAHRAPPPSGMKKSIVRFFTQQTSDMWDVSS